MKKIITEILFGFAIIIIVLLLEFLVTLPFAAGDGKMISLEFWLVALPAGILTYLSAMILKTSTKGEALRKGLIWSVMLLLFYLLIGVANNNVADIFRSTGLYALLLLALLGPMIYALVRKQPPKNIG